MTVEPYQQSFASSCLAACFLMLRKAKKGISFDREGEREVWESGSDIQYPFYCVGIAQEFSKKFAVGIEIIVDNRYFTNVLKKAFGPRSRCTVHYQKISITSINNFLTKGPVICHIDDHSLGNYSHCSHFVILEKNLSGERFLIVDPWHGKKKRLRSIKLEESILSLKKHIKMCPLLFRMTD